VTHRRGKAKDARHGQKTPRSSEEERREQPKRLGRGEGYLVASTARSPSRTAAAVLLSSPAAPTRFAAHRERLGERHGASSRASARQRPLGAPVLTTTLYRTCIPHRDTAVCP